MTLEVSSVHLARDQLENAKSSSIPPSRSIPQVSRAPQDIMKEKQHALDRLESELLELENNDSCSSTNSNSKSPPSREAQASIAGGTIADSEILRKDLSDLVQAGVLSNEELRMIQDASLYPSEFPNHGNTTENKGFEAQQKGESATWPQVLQKRPSNLEQSQVPICNVSALSRLSSTDIAYDPTWTGPPPSSFRCTPLSTLSRALRCSVLPEREVVCYQPATALCDARY
eukprot:2118807-Rhodomonas_salina.2